MSAPVDYTNDIAASSAASDNFISINNAVDLDLFGQVNAESSRNQNTSVVPADSLTSFSVPTFPNGGKSFHLLLFHFHKQTGGELKVSRIRANAESNGSVVTDTRANIHYSCYRIW